MNCITQVIYSFAGTTVLLALHSCALPACSLLYRGEGQVKYCQATLSVVSKIITKSQQ